MTTSRTTRTTRRTPVRKYPRDLQVGARVQVRLAGYTRTTRAAGELTVLDKVPGRSEYAVEVQLDNGERVHWRQSANAKLDLAPRAR